MWFFWKILKIVSFKSYTLLPITFLLPIFFKRRNIITFYFSKYYNNFIFNDSVTFPLKQPLNHKVFMRQLL